MGPPSGPPGGGLAALEGPKPWWNTVGGRQGIALVAVAFVVVIALVAIPSNSGAAASRSGTTTSRPRAKPTRVERTPTKTTGANPFTESVSVPPPSSTTSTVPAATVSPAAVASSGLTTQPGSTPGLYGGTRNIASCDSQQLIDFLAANPDKARAWAAVEGITPADIPAYIRSLTPVLLRADTAVTNHGYSNGRAIPLQSVLQAGTAVLVDQFGVPRARCYCGNPLLPPAPVTPVYTGPTWSGFNPQGVVTVAPAPAPIIVIQIIDINTGTPFDRPAGTDGSEDGPVDAGVPQSTTTTTTTSAPPGSAPTTDPSGVYTLTPSTPMFSGEAGLLMPSDCEGVKLTTINVRIEISGRSITIEDLGDQPLVGTYDPDNGTFTASRTLPPPIAGAAEVQTMKGQLSDTGFTGGFGDAVSPPTAACSYALTGTKVS